MFEQEEERVNLTPEQQRQLALIESMPLTMETEVTQEQWDLKTPEEKEKIIGQCAHVCCVVGGAY